MEITDKELLTSVEEIANLGSYELDLSMSKWTGSENFIDIFGLPQKEYYTEEEFQELVHPEDFEEVMAYFGKCLNEQRDFNCEYRCIKPDGEVIHVLSRSNIYYDDDGNPEKVIGVKQDITEQKKAQLRISRLNDLNKKKNQVLGIVAHDLRSPISQILGLVELLKAGAEEGQQETFNLIIEACKSANDIITDLLELAQAENSIEQLKKTRTNINNLIDQSVSRLKFKFEEKGQELKTHFAENAQAFVDKSKFSRLIDNLLSNAIKFSHKGEIITISTEHDDGSLLLKVKDNGIGIKPEYIPLLFDENKKAIRRKGTEGERSTGLGLTIVKQIVDMHNADISVQSEVDEGTEFTIQFNMQEDISNVKPLNH